MSTHHWDELQLTYNTPKPTRGTPQCDELDCTSQEEERNELPPHFSATPHTGRSQLSRQSPLPMNQLDQTPKVVHPSTGSFVSKSRVAPIQSGVAVTPPPTYQNGALHRAEKSALTTFGGIDNLLFGHVEQQPMRKEEKNAPSSAQRRKHHPSSSPHHAAPHPTSPHHPPRIRQQHYSDSTATRHKKLYTSAAPMHQQRQEDVDAAPSLSHSAVTDTPHQPQFRSKRSSRLRQ